MNHNADDLVAQLVAIDGPCDCDSALCEHWQAEAGIILTWALYSKPDAPQPPQPLSRPRRKSRKQQVEEELKASDVTATLAERENIIYGPHDSLPQCGEHIARVRRRESL